jgi:hypothetical protein
MRPAFAFLGLMMLASAAAADWHDPAARYRRAVTLAAPAERISGDERVVCRMLISDLPGDARISIISSTGSPARSTVVWRGPGDTAEIAFDALKGVREYYAYFGAGSPTEPPKNRGGLLLEMRSFQGPLPEQVDAWPAAFESAKTLIGRKSLAFAQLGMNPFGNQVHTISRISGAIFVPAKGDYTFALAADDKAALFIDGKGLIVARHSARDARFQERLYLDRGWHELLLCHGNQGGEALFGVFWKRPGGDKFESIGRESFGLTAFADVGVLEQRGTGSVADFEAAYQAEAFFGDNYSHRYRFTARPKPMPAEVKCRWEFGDGQSAEGAEAQHVFLTRGVYPVTLTTERGQQRSSQTFRIAVDRDFERSDKPATDDLAIQAKLAAAYDFKKLAPDPLTWAALLFLRVGNRDAAVAAAAELVSRPEHPNLPAARKVLEEFATELPKQGRVNGLVQVWLQAPETSDLQPWVACEAANLLTWWNGDLAAAMKAIAPLKDRDDRSRRIYGQLLVLSGRVDEGRRILEALPVLAHAARQSALSGAMARTTEFYITEGRWEDGEAAWEKWQTQFPASFLAGHSVLLRVELLALRKAAVPAANIAEAYAAALPQSPYAPRLLDRAAKLLEPVDAPRAQAVREVLRQRYPEDPLSKSTTPAP